MLDKLQVIGFSLSKKDKGGKREYVRQTKKGICC
ncbi:hypothetical protein SAMN04490355_1010111 [Pelosinus propionicus DSM 13327]|uniref:Uncharacterized protein n=1 Tax=Pelosinus propionicus DSM 13327 TaxID=1123291 RepID=A0A1I4J2X6_9FIRM|nr:hypothetical protein SAMN04490355_1010111 [Pelosinus propionicus DSM 13327]